MLTYLIDTVSKTICINTQKRHLPRKVSFTLIFLYSYILIFLYSYILMFLCFYFSITDSSSCIPSGKKAFTINLFGVTVIVI